MKSERVRERFFAGLPRYRFLDVLGRGGMGIVFLAEDTHLEETVALKVLSPDLEGDEEDLLLRFKREINLNRRVKHPNVARIHDFGTSGDFAYVSMEFVPGIDLRTLVNREGRLAPARAVAILRQVALGTDEAHKQSIVHRDLKSQNVMVDHDGAVAILDFGLARAMRSERRQSLDSIMIGTPHYMPPEQALGDPTDARSDIYSIGVIAYEMLTGQVPFTAESPILIAMKHVSDPIPLDPLYEARVSDELIAILLRALEKEPADRYSTAAELEVELSELPPQSEQAVPLPTVVASLAALTPAPSPPRPPEIAPPDVEVGAPGGDVYDIDMSDLEQEETPRPVSRAPTPRSATPSRPRPSSSSRGMTAIQSREPVVLVVGDDDAGSEQRLADVLASHGCVTRAVPDGESALENVVSALTDLVLMDVDLPGMDGFDVTRILKAQPATAPLPVVLLSSRMDRNRYAFALQSGAAEVLGKPVFVDAMLARLWSILKLRGFVPPRTDHKLRRLLESPPVARSGEHVAPRLGSA